MWLIWGILIEVFTIEIELHLIALIFEIEKSLFYTDKLM